MAVMSELDHLFARFKGLVDPRISTALFAAAPSGISFTRLVAIPNSVDMHCPHPHFILAHAAARLARAARSHAHAIMTRRCRKGGP